MNNLQNKINKIFAKVRKNGTLIQKAQSAWGSDRWKDNDITAILEDDGYTIGLITENIIVRITNNKIIFNQGTEDDINKLYRDILGVD